MTKFSAPFSVLGVRHSLSLWHPVPYWSTARDSSRCNLSILRPEIEAAASSGSSSGLPGLEYRFQLTVEDLGLSSVGLPWCPGPLRQQLWNGHLEGPLIGVVYSSVLFIWETEAHEVGVTLLSDFRSWEIWLQDMTGLRSIPELWSTFQLLILLYPW